MIGVRHSRALAHVIGLLLAGALASGCEDLAGDDGSDTGPDADVDTQDGVTADDDGGDVAQDVAAPEDAPTPGDATNDVAPDTDPDRTPDAGADGDDGGSPDAQPPPRDVPEGALCFRGNPTRVEGVYYRTDSGGAGDLVFACDEGWSCSADLSTCATPDHNPGASRVCRNDLLDGRTTGRVVWKSDLAGSTQQWPTLQECAENTPICNPDGSLTCTSSVIDTSSPFSRFSCPTTDEIENPTGLDTDCRCAINQVSASGLPQCQRPRAVFDRGETRFGDGPQVGRNGQMRYGFVDPDARELIVAGHWSDASGKYGLLWAVSLDSGNRRILTGTFLDATAGFAQTTVGSGPALVEPYHVQQGPDGAYYMADNLRVGNVRVVRVDPETGDRTVAWDSTDLENFGWCPHRNPSAAMMREPAEAIRTRTFAMDGDGNFYFANQQGGRASGIAILRISADGQTCADVTRSGATGTNGYVEDQRGGGYLVSQGDYSALSIDGDVMYAVNMVNNTLIQIDLATGDRRLLSAASASQRVGSGPTGRDGIPNWHTFADPVDPDYVWVVGDEQKTLMVRVQKSTGNRYPISPLLNQPKWERFVHGPIFTGNMGAGGMWFDPANPDVVYFVHDLMSIVVAEVSTKNNRILSL